MYKYCITSDGGDGYKILKIADQYTKINDQIAANGSTIAVYYYKQLNGAGTAGSVSSMTMYFNSSNFFETLEEAYAKIEKNILMRIKKMHKRYHDSLSQNMNFLEGLEKGTVQLIS